MATIAAQVQTHLRMQQVKKACKAHEGMAMSSVDFKRGLESATKGAL